jgi:hypothetical protein
MTDFNGYAVFFFPQALEALGGALKPYLQEGAAEPHVLCREIDAGGPLIQLTMDGRTTSGQAVDLQLILPTNMIRMIVSARSDPAFGFGPRTAVEPVPDREALVEDEPGPAHSPATTAKKGAGKNRPASKRAKKGATQQSADNRAKKRVAKRATKKAAKKVPTKVSKKVSKKK